MGVLFIFFIALRPPLDPDLGWHLKDGEYLLDHHFQVAKSDIFSYSMPDFPLIMHEWVTDSLMWVLYEKLGLFSLSLFFATIAALAFILASFGVKAKNEYKVIAAMLGIIASIPILGTRPQMLSLLGLSLVIFIIFKFRNNTDSKSIYWLPLIMFLWVNLHGGFAVGLFFVGLFLGIETGKQVFIFALGKLKKASLSEWINKQTISTGAIKKLSAVFFFSSLVTLINPYGWRMYIEVVTTAFDKYARSNIGEWLPVLPTNPMSFQFIIYLVLLAILLIFSWKRLDYTYILISGVFCYLGFSSWRHMPVFLIVSTPLWVGIVESLVGRELINVIRKKWFLFLFLLVLAILANQRFKDSFENSTTQKIAEVGTYPLGAVEYLKENPIEGNMFNEYNWGGFLVWQYPEKKTYIDGRMPSWRKNGFSIFEEFNKTMRYDEGWNETFDKYNINFALVYNNQINEMMFSSIDWKKVYSDPVSLIFLREERK